MSEVVIKVKPDTVSYEDISRFMAEAHKTLEKDGISMNTINITADELRKKVGDEGVFFVALDGEKLVGCGAITPYDLERWYVTGKAVTFRFWAVSPEYRGQKVASRILTTAIEYSEQHGYDIVVNSMAENNIACINMQKKYGFQLIEYMKVPSLDHCSVKMALWLKEKPFKDRYVKYKYVKSKVKLKMKQYLKK